MPFHFLTHAPAIPVISSAIDFLSVASAASPHAPSSAALLAAAPSVVAIVFQQNGEDTSTVYVSSPLYADDDVFYHFYLGHNVDSPNEIETDGGNDIIVYPDCDFDVAKRILYSAFSQEEDIEVSWIDDIDDIGIFVDDRLGKTPREDRKGAFSIDCQLEEVPKRFLNSEEDYMLDGISLHAANEKNNSMRFRSGIVSEKYHIS